MTGAPAHDRIDHESAHGRWTLVRRRPPRWLAPWVREISGCVERASLAELAAACGYADQAHFNRDFLAFAGESPGALRARLLPDGSGIAAAPR
jgi:AraC-like DNA-binding protein